MSDSQNYPQDRQKGLKKKKINIQKFRPSRSAMQWHCGLRLFLKIYLQYGTYATVHGMCIKTSFQRSF